MGDLLIHLLQDALISANQRRDLLQDREILQQILNDIPARTWLFQQAIDTYDKNRATKARLLIVAILQYCARIWRGDGSISADVYEEALARTWEWFSQRLSQYEPETASFTTWFNNKLKWVIKDVVGARKEEEARRFNPPTSPGDEIDPTEDIPATESNSWEETLDGWRDLVKRDPQNNLRDCRMKNHKHVNCQNLLLAIFEQLETRGFVDWDAIAAKFKVDPTSIKRFCKSRCSSRYHSLLDS